MVSPKDSFISPVNGIFIIKRDLGEKDESQPRGTIRKDNQRP